MNTLDFSKDKVQSLDYETLLKTVPENDYLGKPIGGHYHYEVIDRICLPPRTTTPNGRA